MKNYLIDLDGTLYRGMTKIEYADIFIKYLNDNSRKYLFVTNCPLNSQKEIAEKLKSMGIDADSQRVLNSAMATRDYLVKAGCGKKIYIIGSKALKDELFNWGFNIVESDPDIVVVGYDREFTYKKLEKACLFIRGGAQFIGTNIDATIPSGNTFIPHTGSILASISKSTGVEPICIGKPARYMLKSAAKILGCREADCAVIGDRLDTDMAFAINNGIPGYLVLTGTTDMSMLSKSYIKPDMVFDNLLELIKYESMEG